MCNFRDPNLVTFYLCIYRPSILNEEHFTFHLQYKHSGTFANCKYEELSEKNQKMCDPILVTLLKMPPHESQSSRENETPSSGTCPLASYKVVPPTPPPGCDDRGVWNPEYSSRNPSIPSTIGIRIQVPLTKNPESSTWYLESKAWNPGSPTVSWIPQHGASCFLFIRFCSTSYIPWVRSKNCSFIDRMMGNGYRKQRTPLVLCTI